MKKSLPIIIILIILLIVSIGANIYLVLNINTPEEKEEVYIKYKDKTITKNDFIEDSIKRSSKSYLLIMKDEILLEELSKEERKENEEEVDKQISSLEKTYGDELDSIISIQTNYLDQKEYRRYLIINSAYEKRAEENCESETDYECQAIEYYNEMLKVLENADITFKNDKLKEEWEEIIQELKDAKKILKVTTERTKPTTEFKTLTEIDLNELRQFINDKKDFVLIITQSTCSHCVEFKPIMDEIGEENNKTFYFIETDKLNENEYKELKNLIDFSGTPTTVIYKNSVVVNTYIGSIEKDKMINNLKEQGIL